TLVKPHGYPGETTQPKKRKNGYPGETVKAKIDASTVTPVKHLQLPGDRGVRVGGKGEDVGAGAVRAAIGVPPRTEAPAAKSRQLPWRKPAVPEISFDDLPPELRLLALGLPLPDDAQVFALAAE